MKENNNKKEGNNVKQRTGEDVLLSYGVSTEKLEEIVRSVKPLFLDRERSGQVKVKGIADFVTSVDMAVQELVERRLKEEYPQIQFMGEEKDNSNIDTTRPVWILDPVDGTTNLIHDFKNSALSLALYAEGKVQLGIVYQPYTEEFFIAVRGKGAFCNGAPIHVSSVSKMEESLISIGTSPYHHELAEENFRNFKNIFLHCADIRRIGSAAIELAWVACGRIEVFFERNLKPWDYAAGLLLVEEAGGEITDFDGDCLPVVKPADVVAGNGVIGKILREDFLGG